MIHDRIEINPAIMFGKPVIKSTRITVEHILRKLAGGMTIDQILTAIHTLRRMMCMPLLPSPPTIWLRKRSSSLVGSAYEIPGE